METKKGVPLGGAFHDRLVRSMDLISVLRLLIY